MTLDRYRDAVDAFRRARQLPRTGRRLPGRSRKRGSPPAADRSTMKRAPRCGACWRWTHQPAGALSAGAGSGAAGRVRAAAQGWAESVALSPADAAWLPTTREHLEQAARRAGIDPATIQPSAEARALAARVAAMPTPSAADAAAAEETSSEERTRMVRDMVERLAARLRDNPGDLEGGAASPALIGCWVTPRRRAMPRRKSTRSSAAEPKRLASPTSAARSSMPSRQTRSWLRPARLAAYIAWSAPSRRNSGLRGGDADALAGVELNGELAQTIDDRRRLLRLGVRQHQDELLAAVTTDLVVAAEIGDQVGGKRLPTPCRRRDGRACR